MYIHQRRFALKINQGRIAHGNKVLRALSMKHAKPVSPAWSVLHVMESAYDKGNVIKRCRVCRRCSGEATVNGKRPKIPNGDLFKQSCM